MSDPGNHGGCRVCYSHKRCQEFYRYFFVNVSKLYLCHSIWLQFSGSSFSRSPDPNFSSLDPGSKKAPDPGSGFFFHPGFESRIQWSKSPASRIRNTVFYVKIHRYGTLSLFFAGNFCIDEKILREEGVTDFKQYLGAKGGKEEDLMPDFFLDEFLEVEQQGLGEIVLQSVPILVD